MRFRLYRNVMVIALALVAAVGCDETVNDKARVVVSFKQVANFHDYLFPAVSEVTHGAGDGMFIMYKVTQIQNTGSEAKKFELAVYKVVTITPDKNSNVPVPDANSLLGSQNVEKVEIGVGETKHVDGCFIKLALTSQPSSPYFEKVGVLYKDTPDQPVMMKNLAPKGKVVTLYNAWPANLQSLCANN